MSALIVLAALGVPLVSEAGSYLDFGVISISVANALVIAAMVVLFVLAIVVPFPVHEGDDTSDGSRP